MALSQPWPEFPWYLYLDGRFLIEAPAQLDSPDCASKLIGTGPFKLDHWTVNQELVATKNPDYWQKDSKGTQLPYLDKITFKPVAEAVQRINSLQGGQLDLIHTSDGQQVDALENQLKGQFNVLEGARRSQRGALLPPQRGQAAARRPQRPQGGGDGHRPQPDQPDPQQRRLPHRQRPVRHQGHRLHEEPRLPAVQPQGSHEAGQRLQGRARRAVQRRARAHQRPRQHAGGRAHQGAALQGGHRRHAEAGRPDRVHRRRGRRQLQHPAVAQPPR